MRGVAEQDDVFVNPALVAHAREVQPIPAAQMGAIAHQAVAAQVRLEEPLAERQRLLGIGRIEAVGKPCLLTALDDKRAELLIEAIRMYGKPSVLGSFEQKRERVERKRRPEPNEPALPPVEIRPERRRVGAANAAVDPVGTDEQIALRAQRGDVVDLTLEAQLDAELGGAAL